MLRNETKQILAEFEDQEWLKEYPEFEINLPHVEYNQIIKGMPAILEFIEQQIDGWNNKVKIIDSLRPSIEYFHYCNNQLLFFLKNNIQTPISERNNSWHSLLHQCNRELVNRKVYLFDSPEVLFIDEVAETDAAEAEMAFTYLSNQPLDTIRYRYGFNGIIKAFFFAHPKLSASRAKFEKQSLTNIRKEYETYIADAANNLQKHLDSSSKSIKAQYDTFISLKEQSEQHFQEWFEDSQKQFTTFHDTTIQRIKVVEELYTEQLRMEAPAKQWKLRATRLKNEGRKYLCWLTVLVIMGSISLYLLLWHTPKDMLESIFNGDKATAIRWSIVFVIFLSFLAYGIRILAKITFSSFHLARDAEEREQLTHVYLALKKDSAVTEQDRSMVLQAIFSRADTGLLKEDSSPTMPNGIDRLINRPNV